MTIYEKLESLLTASNTATGISDTDLTSAIRNLIAGYGGGSTPTGVYVGTLTSPSALFGTVTITTGFAPKIVGAWCYDDVHNINTYTVVYGITTESQIGVFFQDGGFSRTYTANNTTGGGKGHIIGTSSTGFTFQTCETYFAGKQVTVIALGDGGAA